MTNSSVKWTHKTTAWGGQREVITVTINGETKASEFEGHDAAMYFKEGAEAAIRLFERKNSGAEDTLPCVFCEDAHPVKATGRHALAAHSGHEVAVTIVDRFCDRTRQAFINTQDHDHRFEARHKINEKLGNPKDQRLPGVRIVAEEKRGSADVPAT